MKEIWEQGNEKFCTLSKVNDGNLVMFFCCCDKKNFWKCNVFFFFYNFFRFPCSVFKMIVANDQSEIQESKLISILGWLSLVAHSHVELILVKSCLKVSLQQTVLSNC